MIFGQMIFGQLIFGQMIFGQMIVFNLFDMLLKQMNCWLKSVCVFLSRGKDPMNLNVKERAYL